MAAIPETKTRAWKGEKLVATTIFFCAARQMLQVFTTHQLSLIISKLWHFCTANVINTKKKLCKIFTNLPWHIWKRGHSHWRQLLYLTPGCAEKLFSSPGHQPLDSRHRRRPLRHADAWHAVWARSASSASRLLHWKTGSRGQVEDLDV